MISKVFTIYDSKVEAYLNPFMCRSVGEALRMFKDAVNKPDHPFFSHAEDFILFHIADYDDQKGKYENLDKNVSYGNGVEFKIQPVV